MSRDERPLREVLEARVAERERLRGELARERASWSRAPSESAAGSRAMLRRRARLRFVASLLVFGLVAGGGAAWFVRASSFEPVHLRGSVTEVRGSAPVRAGDPCRVDLSPAYLPRNAWLRVDCAGARLYGYDSMSGAIECALEGGRPLECLDEAPIHRDGDPIVTLRASTRTLRIGEPGRWSARITTEPAP